jgi:hypothetical protein
MINLKSHQSIAREIIKKKLWTFGYNVNDVSKTYPFDLLVNNKYKVTVKYLKYLKSKDGWNVESLKTTYSDIYAFILVDEANGYKIYYGNKFVKGCTLVDIEILKGLGFSKNPKEIFNGDVKKISFIPRELKLKDEEWYSLRDASILLLLSEYSLKGKIEKELKKDIN